MRELNSVEIRCVSGGAGITFEQAESAVNTLTGWLSLAIELIPNSAIKQVAKQLNDGLKDAGHTGLKNLRSLYEKTATEAEKAGAFLPLGPIPKISTEMWGAIYAYKTSWAAE
jgi:hypothetical protein